MPHGGCPGQHLQLMMLVVVSLFLPRRQCAPLSPLPPLHHSAVTVAGAPPSASAAVSQVTHKEPDESVRHRTVEVLTHALHLATTTTHACSPQHCHAYRCRYGGHPPAHSTFPLLSCPAMLTCAAGLQTYSSEYKPPSSMRWTCRSSISSSTTSLRTLSSMYLQAWHTESTRIAVSSWLTQLSPSAHSMPTTRHSRASSELSNVILHHHQPSLEWCT